MESIVETKASSLVQFIHGLQGELHVTWEEGGWAAWLYDLLKPHVMRASYPTYYARGCCGRSTTESTDCGRCANWRAAIKPSARI
jgi:hypothetical protein